MAASEDARQPLAPEEQPGFVPLPGDLAAWLFVVSPMGEPAAVAAAAPPSVLSAPSGVELADLVQRWVRRVGLGGDTRRGVARLELGAGRFAGAELWVVAEGSRVSVELSLPPAASADGLAERLARRLEARGLGAEVTLR